VTFEHLFDAQAADYSRYRPGYPDALFEHLAALAPSRRLAWDVGTGSGQAAVRLADDFDHVVATDSSAIQLSHAPPHPKITYRVAPAHAGGLADGACDLVAAASAVHWFDRAAFYPEVARALRPGGIIAVWCYRLPRTPGRFGARLDELYEILEPHWPAPTRLVRDDYRDLEFPFAELHSPAFALVATWPAAQLLGYISSWTATQTHGRDELRAIARDIDPAQPVQVAIPICMRIGRG